MFPFAELTLADGRKLDIPAASVLFLEGLDDSARETHPECITGLFYDLGPVQGEPANTPTLRSVLVREPFEALAPVVKDASPVPRMEVTTSLQQPVLLLAGSVESLLETEAGQAARCQIMHRVGTRLLRLDVLQTRDELRAALRAAVSPPAPENLNGNVSP